MAMKLDKWDCMIVAHAKRGGQISELEVKRIWAERCNLGGPEHVHLQWIVWHLAALVDDLQIGCLLDLLDRANPNRFAPFVTGETDFLKQWFYALMQTLMVAAVDDLPGYDGSHNTRIKPPCGESETSEPNEPRPAGSA